MDIKWVNYQYSSVDDLRQGQNYHPVELPSDPKPNDHSLVPHLFGNGIWRSEELKNTVDNEREMTTGITIC